MLTDKLMQEFRDGRFEAECASMTLTQRASAKPTCYKGKGLIRQRANGGLEFKLFVETYENTDHRAAFASYLKTPPGTILAEDQYFDLTAQTWTGETWSAEYVSIDTKWSKDHTVLAYGCLREAVLMAPAIPTLYTLKLVLFEEMCFPSNAGRAITSLPITSSVKALGYDFEFLQADGAGTITVSSDKPLPTDLDMRVHEALRFVTAQPLQVSAVIRQGDQKEEVQLRSKRRHSLAAQAFPPLHLNSWMMPKDGADMFSKYLEFIVAAKTGDYLHPITYHLDNVTEASAGSIDSWAIGLSVATEGIAGLVEPPNMDAHKSLVAEFREWLTAVIDREKKFNALKDRVMGLISMLNNARPADRLTPLGDSGGINADYIKSWTNLRNGQVHPKKSGTVSSGHRDFQTQFNLIGAVTTLLYQIVFHIIGYEGKFTDYGAPKYPERDYPIVPAPKPE